MQANVVSVSKSCRDWLDLNSGLTNRTSEPDREPVRGSISPSSSIGSENNLINDIKLLELLKNSEMGVEVLNMYQKENVLNETHKDILTSVIVDSYSNNRKAMSMSDIISATNAILILFPSENKVRFFCFFNFHIFIINFLTNNFHFILFFAIVIKLFFLRIIITINEEVDLIRLVSSMIKQLMLE